MLSVAAVKSAGGAASYFGKDDYYTGEHSSETSTWGGKGAEELGLSGEVKASAFETILRGILPDGTGVNQTPKRTIGTDLTFSMPKSASVMAYVAGDKRILDAHMSAVKTTMTWVEKTMAEARDYSRSRNGEPVRTGNLVYAIFQHDTSRKLDPQGHLHVVIAAITKTAGGTWQALWNNPLWKNNSAIGSAYHAAFREKLQELGYETNLTGKHGQFEIAGVPKAVLEEFRVLSLGGTPPTSVGNWLQPQTRVVACNLGKNGSRRRREASVFPEVTGYGVSVRLSHNIPSSLPSRLGTEVSVQGADRRRAAQGPRDHPAGLR